MRLLVSLFLLFSAGAIAAPPILLIGDEPGSWSRILSSVGLTITQSTEIPPQQLKQQVEAGTLAILQGTSAHSAEFGITATGRNVPTRNIVDVHNPEMSIIWEKTLDLPVHTLPAGARVFAKERWTGAPVVAGIRAGAGSVLWVAAKPGSVGYERFPYLLQAIADLGVTPPIRSNRLWAFFDGAYRSRVDLEYFADRWSAAGISALHVAGWHYFEPDPQQDAWVRQLIDACHRRGILVYVWLELPHVSEKFWHQHPEWREKTALLQDAHLDWRKLMNLLDPDCFRAVSEGVRALATRFDWDGVNLAEPYFESLEGAKNPARFTPMNDYVRREFEQLTGTDPLSFFQNGTNNEGLASFLQYRAELTRRMQAQWIGVVEQVRSERPHLDLTLTHVDDRFDTRMRDLIGADAARVLPMLDQHDFTFLIEDPATIWHLGPERYLKIAEQYKPLTPHQQKLAIDLNIVERYQDVYPTKQQTGVELFQLVHQAASSFPRVALYFENSILKVDQPLLPAAAAGVTRLEVQNGKVVVESPAGIGVNTPAPPKVNGQTWPVWDGATAWLPRGAFVVENAPEATDLRLTNLNADLRSARAEGAGLEFSYESSARAFARFNRKPVTVEIDGAPVQLQWFGDVLVLPRGQHIVSVR